MASHAKKAKPRKGVKGGPRPRETSAERIAKQQRLQGMLNMRLQGFTLQAIGDSQDPPIRAQTVYTAIKQALDAQLEEPIESVRKIELLRLDDLLTAVYERAINGDIAALDRVLAIQVRRARLAGLDLQAGGGLRLGGGDGPLVEETADGVHTIRVEVIGSPEATRKNKPNGSARTAAADL